MYRLILIALLLPQNASPSVSPRGAVAALVALHNSSWVTLDPETVHRMIIVAVPNIATSDQAIATATDGCGFFIERTYGSGEGGVLSMMFDRVKSGDACRYSLKTIAYEARLTNNAAHVLLTEISVALRAGGKDNFDGRSAEYEWRSRNSATLYQLYLSLSPRVEKAGPDTPTDFKVLLDHLRVGVSEVDALPFERGVVLECP